MSPAVDLDRLSDEQVTVIQTMAHLEAAEIKVTPRSVASELEWDIELVKKICCELKKLGVIAIELPDESSGPRVRTCRA
jgi:hypothetical protein